MRTAGQPNHGLEPRPWLIAMSRSCRLLVTFGGVDATLRRSIHPAPHAAAEPIAWP
jgi:hypothetical protein